MQDILNTFLNNFWLDVGNCRMTRDVGKTSHRILASRKINIPFFVPQNDIKMSYNVIQRLEDRSICGLEAIITFQV